MSIKTNPSKVLHNITDWFTGKGQQALQFIHPALVILERDGREALIAAATSAVAQVKTMDLSTGDKRDEALKIIEKSLLAASVAFVESEARLAVELAYQALKASTGA